jgi:hypothetical protein
MKLTIDNIKKVVVSEVEQEFEMRHLCIEVIDDKGERHLVICSGVGLEKGVANEKRN